MHATFASRGVGGGSLRRLQKPCQTALGIFPRLIVPGGAVADWDVASEHRGWGRLPGRGRLSKGASLRILKRFSMGKAVS